MSAHDVGADCANCGGAAAPPARAGSAYDATVSDRVRALALDIAHRLRPVCLTMPDDELLALTTRMAIVELKYFEGTVPAAMRRRSATG